MMNLMRATEEARKHGATWGATERYDGRRDFTTGRLLPGAIFAYYFFNDDDKEVGHWLVDFDHFTPVENRIWGGLFLRRLTNHFTV